MVTLNAGTTPGAGYSVRTTLPGSMGAGVTGLTVKLMRTLGGETRAAVIVIVPKEPQLWVAMAAEAGVIIATDRPRADAIAMIARLSFDMGI